MQRERDRQEKKAEKLAKYREAARAGAGARGAGGEGVAGDGAGAVTWLAEGLVLAMFVLALVLVWHAGW